ncbi:MULTISPECIES: hypothetical protein [Gracilibacillus]|uniref:hypothetical protein n=1 Tax=Gracilibacillus TaxID=74385 RepID=UPI0008247F8E|nr:MULTISPECIES: hypothetical protein [Gracilibacillus]
MNHQIKGMLYYYTQGVLHSTKIFWTILVAIILTMNIICYLLLDVADFEMYFAIPFATYTNVAIVSYQLIKGNVPFGLKMGATRKNIYIMQLYFMVLYSFAMAVAASTFRQIIEWLQQWAGITNYQFVHPAMALTDNWAMRIVVDTLVMFFLMAALYLIALIFYRTGLLGGGILLGAMLVTVLFGVFEGWMIDLVMNVIPNVDFMSFVILFAIGIVFSLIGFPFMRRITIVQTR